MRALKPIKECSEMWVGYYFSTAAWFLPKFMDIFFGILFESWSNSVKTNSGAWYSTDRQKHYSCKALTLLPVEVLMTLWPLISSLLLLSCCAPDFFSFFQYTLEESKHLMLSAQAQLLCLRSEKNPQAAFPLLYCEIFLRCYLTDICCPPADEWAACGQLTPAWRLISLGGFLNWRTLCLRDGMKTNGQSHTAGNGASQTSFCPRWSAIMSVSIRQFIWAALLQMMSVLGKHICFLLLEKSWRSAVSSDSFPLQWVQFQSFAVSPGLHQNSRAAQ